MTLRVPSDAMASEILPPLIIFAKVDKIGKHGGRHLQAVRLAASVGDRVEAELAVAAFDHS